MYQDAKPPLNTAQQQLSKLQDKALSSTSRTQGNSKWAINIQEIVKRTQRNLERGNTNANSSITRTFEDKNTTNLKASTTQTQKLSEDTNLSKASNLYKELKHKLSADSNKRANSSSAKDVLRPQSTISGNKNLLQKQQMKKEGSREMRTLHDQFYTKPKPAPSIQSNPGFENFQTNNFEEEEDAEIEAQLFLMGGGLGVGPRHASSTHKPEASKRLDEIENRQKIFEDEIVKRIKDIQRYSKSIHLQVKKQATAQNSLEEGQEQLENQIMQLMAKSETSNSHQIDQLINTNLSQFTSELKQQILAELHQKISELRQHVDRQAKQQVDLKSLESNFQNRIDNSSRSLAAQLEDLQLKMSQIDQSGRESIERVSKKQDTSLRSVNQKLEQIEQKLYKYEVKLSDLKSGKEESESICNIMKLELQGLIEETESKNNNKMYGLQKKLQELQLQIEQCHGKVAENQRTFNDFSEVLTQLKTKDGNEIQCEEIVQKFEQKLKQAVSEMQNHSDQSNQKVKKTLQQIQSTTNQLQQQQSQLVDSCVSETRLQEVVSEVEEQYQKNLDKNSQSLQTIKLQVDQAMKQIQTANTSLQREIQEVRQKIVDEVFIKQNFKAIDEKINMIKTSQPVLLQTKIKNQDDEELNLKLYQIELKLAQIVQSKFSELGQEIKGIQSKVSEFGQEIKGIQSKVSENGLEIQGNQSKVNQTFESSNKLQTVVQKLATNIQQVENQHQQLKAISSEQLTSMQVSLTQDWSLKLEKLQTSFDSQILKCEQDVANNKKQTKDGISMVQAKLSEIQCDNDLVEDVTQIRQDVQSLIEFKNQIRGAQNQIQTDMSEMANEIKMNVQEQLQEWEKNYAQSTTQNLCEQDNRSQSMLQRTEFEQILSSFEHTFKKEIKTSLNQSEKALRQEIESNFSSVQKQIQTTIKDLENKYARIQVQCNDSSYSDQIENLLSQVKDIISKILNLEQINQDSLKEQQSLKSRLYSVEQNSAEITKQNEVLVNEIEAVVQKCDELRSDLDTYTDAMQTKQEFNAVLITQLKEMTQQVAQKADSVRQVVLQKNSPHQSPIDEIIPQQTSVNIEQKFDEGYDQNEGEGSFIEDDGINNKSSDKLLNLKLDSDNHSLNASSKEEFVEEPEDLDGSFSEFQQNRQEHIDKLDLMDVEIEISPEKNENIQNEEEAAIEAFIMNEIFIAVGLHMSNK